MFVGVGLSNAKLSVEIGKVLNDHFQKLKATFGKGLTKDEHTIDVREMHAQRTQLMRIVLF
jgi:hypothetical protein